MLKKFILDHKIIIAIIIVFLIARLFIYYFLDIKLSNLSYEYHLLNKDLLYQDLFKSMLYLHSQPYLWNLFNGWILKLFDGDLILVYNFFNYYHKILSIISIIIYYNFLRLFKLSNLLIFIILLFITLNPNIIFYENLFSYSHTTFFIFNVLIFLIAKFFMIEKNNLYEIGIYICIFLLGNIWLLFQPLLLIPISFVIIRFFKKFNYLTFVYAFIFFLISLSPIIKNKLIFNEFILNSKGGQDIGTVFYNWEEYCGHPIKNKKEYIDKYFNKHQLKKNLNHESLVGPKAGFNHVGMIPFGQQCFKLTVKKIKESPSLYIKGRILSFLASHGKFGFDYVYPVPMGWKNQYSIISKLYTNSNYKLIRQVIVFTIMLIVYFYILKFILNRNTEKNMKYTFLFITLIYLYLLLVGTFAAGTEQERILYTGFGIYMLFFISFFNNLRKKGNVVQW